jgi:hypothetical protein
MNVKERLQALQAKQERAKMGINDRYPSGLYKGRGMKAVLYADPKYVEKMHQDGIFPVDDDILRRLKGIMYD